ncbi:MAG: hypothetical protein ACK5KO_08375 [Arachnia sp.]
MIITEAELRDQLRRPSPGATVMIPTGARLSPAATDFVAQWSLVVTTVAQPEQPPPVIPSADEEWDTASVFPVNLGGETPTCTCCGMAVTTKVSGLTQLNAFNFALKTHPRIKLRGRVDSLHAMVLLTQRKAVEADEAELARDMGTIAAYCRELTSAEYNERPVAELRLAGWDAEAIHRATHDPKASIGVDHLTINATDPELQHLLNLARTMAREVEVAAMEAFPSPHHPYGASICGAFNRLSSTVYFLQLRLAAGQGK